MVSDRLTCESWAVFNCEKVFIHIVDLLWICKQILKNTLFSHFFVLLFAHNFEKCLLCIVNIKQHELLTNKFYSYDNKNLHSKEP